MCALRLKCLGDLEQCRVGWERLLHIAARQLKSQPRLVVGDSSLRRSRCCSHWCSSLDSSALPSGLGFLCLALTLPLVGFDLRFDGLLSLLVS